MSLAINDSARSDTCFGHPFLEDNVDPLLVDRWVGGASGDGVDLTGTTGAGFDDQVAFRGKGVLFVKGKGDRNEVDFDDVNQEGLSDCYLLGSLATLAREDPAAIKNMIKPRADGTYDVTLYRRDRAGALQRHIENVDPRRFSVGASGPGDVSGGSKEIWAMVIEKAYAQMNGGYSAIGNGGNWEVGMEALTGRESTTSSSAALSFERVSQALKKNQPVVINTVNPGSDPTRRAALNRLNLVPWHTYAVVDAKVEKGVPMVKLYNPWGNQPATQPGVDGKSHKTDGGWVTYSDLTAAGIWQGTAIGEGTRPIRA
jgi:hypothetical protein